MKQKQTLAWAFGVISIATAVILVTNVPQWLSWVFAVFWTGTGLLGLYQGMKYK